MAKASMRHVALRARVSVQTVSRVLNEPGKVSPDTRARVQEAIDELGYQPDMAARALRTQRSGLVGFMVHGGSRTGPSSAVARMAETARAAGFSSLVMSVSPDDPGSSQEALDALLARNVEGIVSIAAQQWAADAAVEVARHLPVVLVSSRSGPCELSRVAIDQTHGVRQVVEHFAAQGLTRPLHVAGPLDWFDAEERRRAWVQAMDERGWPVALVQGSFLPGSGYTVGQEIAADPLPEAILAANDFVAFGVMRALHDAGHRVPDDVAVVGIDDAITNPYTVPSLSSIRQPIEALADAALELLGDAIAGRPPRTLLIEPELVVRESSVRR